MTISTSQSTITTAGTGALQLFQFPFVVSDAADIEVIYTDANGTETTLSSTQYTLTVNPILTGQIWPIGGTVLYPIIGSPIAIGTFLTISRVLPLTQQTSVRNQGNFYPQVTEEALDTLCMQIQQIADSGGNVPGEGSAVFIATEVGGSPNAITVSETAPADFSLSNGVILTVTPPSLNTLSGPTLNVLGTGDIVIYKPTLAGNVPVDAGDIGGYPLLLQYNSLPNYWLGFNITPVPYEVSFTTNQALGLAEWQYNYVATGGTPTVTIAQSAGLVNFWYVDLFAQTVPIIIAINASDTLNGGVAGVGLTMPIGTSGRLSTDANGHLFLSGTAGQTRQSDAWTPTLSFGTPGDLNVTYAIRAGTWTKVGRLVFANFAIVTTTFTHSTASGNLLITGFPFTSLTASTTSNRGEILWSGISAPASYTQANITLGSNTTSALFQMSGNGVSPITVGTTYVPSSGIVNLQGTLIYQASS